MLIRLSNKKAIKHLIREINAVMYCVSQAEDYRLICNCGTFGIEQHGKVVKTGTIFKLYNYCINNHIGVRVATEEERIESIKKIMSSIN